MNDDELRDSLRRSVPPPGPGYWDKIDASLEAAASDDSAGTENSPGGMEIESPVIRLTDMNHQQSTSPRMSRALTAAAAVIALVGVGAVALAVNGRNSDPSDVLVSDTNTSPLDSALPVDSTVPIPTGPSPTATVAPPTTAAPEPLPLAIPEQIQGTWRQSDGAAVSVDECRSESDFEENFGRVLNITAGGFSIFETGGQLIEVHAVDAARIDATYDTTYADTPTQERIVFEAQENGTVLIMSSDDRPSPTRYLPCPDPATTPDAALALSIPDAIQGEWRETEGAVVTADECRIDAGFEANFGKILSINPDRFSFFEEGGRLIEVYQREDSRIDALFDTTYADTATEDRYTFDVLEGDSVLLVSSGDRPGPIRYLRCPA